MKTLSVSILIGGFCLSSVNAFAADKKPPADKNEHHPVQAAGDHSAPTAPESASAQHGGAHVDAQSSDHDAKTHANRPVMTAADISEHITVHKPTEKPVKVNKTDADLLEAQKKLEALIKAAIGQQSRKSDAGLGENDKDRDQKSDKKQTENSKVQSREYCVAQDAFLIGEKSRMEDYAALTRLKNSIIVGPEQFALEEVRSLVLAYIGLGFGDEAQNYSGFLEPRDRYVLGAMGRAVSGLVTKKNVADLKQQISCWPEAKLWYEFAKIQLPDMMKADEAIDFMPYVSSTVPKGAHAESKAPVDHGNDKAISKPHGTEMNAPDSHAKNSDEHDTKPLVKNDHNQEAAVDAHAENSGKFVLGKKQIKEIDALPKTLSGLMAKRFGLHKIRNGDLDGAQHMIKLLSGTHKRKGVAHVFDDEAKFFQGHWFLTQANPRAHGIFSKLSQRDGPFQVPSMTILSGLKINHGADLYEGFDTDLDGASHIFNHHPEGMQAIAQKINLFVAGDHLNQAIGMTKEKFSLGDDLYGQSVLRVSERMQIHLKGEDQDQKLHSLNILMREQIFFDALVDGFPLKSAGVGASLDLGLSELAPKILPPTQCSRLDLHLLQEMAIALPKELQTHLPAKAFKPENIKAKKITKAFRSNQPKLAMRELRQDPSNPKLIRTAADQAFENGYWSLARQNLAALKSDEADKSDSHMVVKTELASVLAVPSPHLTPKKGSQTIGDLTHLKTFLDGDIATMKGYIDHE